MVPNGNRRKSIAFEVRHADAEANLNLVILLSFRPASLNQRPCAASSLLIIPFRPSVLFAVRSGAPGETCAVLKRTLGRRCQSPLRWLQLILAAHTAATVFRLSTQSLRLDHAAFLRAAFGPFAAAFLLDGIAPCQLRLPRTAFKFLTKFLPGQLPVCRLRAFPLNPNLDPGGPVPQTNGGGNFIDR